MLALLERAVTDAGGHYAFCDTDSMAIVASPEGGPTACPGGPLRLASGEEAIRMLSWSEVERIRQRFRALNPYDQASIPDSILKIEDVNYATAPDGTRRQRPLTCYAVSAKRYTLAATGADGRRVIVKPSEHGLGHLLSPITRKPEERGRHRWIEALWTHLIAEAVGEASLPPPWFDILAAGRRDFSRPEHLSAFASWHAKRPYADRVKPFNFILTCYAAPGFRPAKGAMPSRYLLAPYDDDPVHWSSPRTRWVDPTGARMPITTSVEPIGRAMRVKTFSDVVRGYAHSPEWKSAAPDGSPCAPDTRGLLARQHVVAGGLTRLGKEANRLEEADAGLIDDPTEVQTTYAEPAEDPWRLWVRPVLQRIPRSELLAEAAVSKSTARRVIDLGEEPSARTRRDLTQAAGAFASIRLEVDRGDDVGACEVFLSLPDHERPPLAGGRVCATCGKPLRSGHGRAKYCGGRCRQAAHRHRKRRSSS